MGDVQHRLALGVEPRQHLEHLRRGVGVEVAGRLIADDQHRITCQRARDRDPLLLTTRQLRRQMIELVPQPDELRGCAPPARTARVWSRDARNRAAAPRSRAPSGLAAAGRTGTRSRRSPPATRRAAPRSSDRSARRRPSPSPRSGRSIPVIMLMIVDLPLPDGPTIATISPVAIDRSTPRNAGYSSLPLRYTFSTPTSSINVVAIARDPEWRTATVPTVDLLDDRVRDVRAQPSTIRRSSATAIGRAPHAGSVLIPDSRARRRRASICCAGSVGSSSRPR